MHPLPWPLAAEVPTLEPLQVHLWQRSLSAPEAEREQLWSVLSAAEQERAQRFVRLQDRQRFAIARGTLRQLLGRYLGSDPGALNFAYGERGKPQLSREGGGLDLRFNLSHSQDLALYAVALGTEVGIDVEKMNPKIDHEGITRRFFSASEQQALFQLPTHQRSRAFFQLWTRKEACIKAMGGSLALGLHQIDVAIALDQAIASIEFCAENGQTWRWWVIDLNPQDSYLGALAIAKPPQAIHCWQWHSQLT